jgi:hypothetical protein
VGRVRGGAERIRFKIWALLCFSSLCVGVDCGVCGLGRSNLGLLDSGPICAKSSSLEKTASSPLQRKNQKNQFKILKKSEKFAGCICKHSTLIKVLRRKYIFNSLDKKMACE